MKKFKDLRFQAHQTPDAVIAEAAPELLESLKDMTSLWKVMTKGIIGGRMGWDVQAKALELIKKVASETMTQKKIEALAAGATFY